MTQVLSNDFAVAVCDHFKLPKTQATKGIQLHVRPDEVFSITLNIALTADDLAGIADRMPGRTVGMLR